MSERLHRCAFHESGHACTAIHFTLPIRRVWIGDGVGRTTFTRAFSWGEVESWVVATLAGLAAEVMVFGDSPIESDERVILSAWCGRGAKGCSSGAKARGPDCSPAPSLVAMAEYQHEP